MRSSFHELRCRDESETNRVRQIEIHIRYCVHSLHPLAHAQVVRYSRPCDFVEVCWFCTKCEASEFRVYCHLVKSVILLLPFTGIIAGSPEAVKPHRVVLTIYYTC